MRIQPMMAECIFIFYVWIWIAYRLTKIWHNFPNRQILNAMCIVSRCTGQLSKVTLPGIVNAGKRKINTAMKAWKLKISSKSVNFDRVSIVWLFVTLCLASHNLANSGLLSRFSMPFLYLSLWHTHTHTHILHLQLLLLSLFLYIAFRVLHIKCVKLL